MKLQFDTLKYANMLESEGFGHKTSRALSATFSNINLQNLYSKHCTLRSKLKQKRWDFLKGAEEHEAQRRELECKLASYEKRIEADIAEARAGCRWLVGTIITCTLALAGYLSACMHMLR